MEYLGMLWNVDITADGIKKVIEKKNEIESILEYIKNSLDAWAKNVFVGYTLADSLQKEIETISIKDDWTWIQHEIISSTFWVFWSSMKKRLKTQSTTQGEHGYGRLCFYNFATDAEWETVYQYNNKNFSYKIKIETKNIKAYNHDDKPVETQKHTGTIVTFSWLKGKILEEKYFAETLQEALREQMFWRFLALWAKIYLNNTEINIESSILSSEKFERNIGKERFKWRYIQRKKFLKNEESKFYCLDTNSSEIFKKNTGLNRKADQFYHSLYITSTYFSDFMPKVMKKWESPLSSNYLNDSIFPKLEKKIEQYLWEKRTPIIQERAKQYISLLYEKKVLSHAKSAIEKKTNEIIENTIIELHTSSPNLVAWLKWQQKDIFFRMLVALLQEGETSKLYSIIDQVLNLDKKQRDTFADILEDISLNSIINMMNLVKARLETIELIKQFVFKKEWNVREVPELQTLISRHYWIFWEEFALLGDAEEDFIENLIKFTYILRGEKLSRKQANMQAEHKNKEVDIFLCKVEHSNNTVSPIVKNIIVELKRPSIILWQKELSQVMTYFTTILEEPRFNGNWFERKFILVGTKYDETMKSALRSGAIYWRDVIMFDSEKKYTVLCKKRSDVILEATTRLSFLKDKLESDYAKLSKKAKVETKEEALEKSDNIAVSDKSFS